MLLRSLLTCLLFLLPLAAFDDGRDFSGKWFLDARRANLTAVSVPMPQTLTVTQRDVAIQCAATYADGSLLRWSYLLDGTETRLTANGATQSSVVKWEGAALLVNTLITGPGDYTVMDRWLLSEGGAVLTITRQVVDRSGQTETSLVYTKNNPEARVYVATPEETALAQPAAPQQPIPQQPTLVRQPAIPASTDFVVTQGTHIGLSLRNALDTKHTSEGTHVYLETIAPIAVAGRIVIPRGSYVNGTVTESKPAKGIKTKGEMYIRFDSIVLPNGVTRDFHSRLVSADAGRVDTSEGKVTGERDSSGDARTVATGGGIGAGVGAIAGSAAGHPLTGVGIGAAAGAGVALATIFHGKKPEAVLPRGTMLEMVLDRNLTFTPGELAY